MNHHVAIPILGAVKRNRLRRETDRENVDGWFETKYNDNMESARQVTKMHLWVDQFTTGRFYLTPYRVAFENEEDFVIFKLWYKE